jgi:hypothetical protein
MERTRKDRNTPETPPKWQRNGNGFLYVDREAYRIGSSLVPVGAGSFGRDARSVGYSEARQSNTAGQLYNAFHVGRYASVNLLWYQAAMVTMGSEWMWGQRENLDGSLGKDRRFQFSANYRFSFRP